jgi:hypothetical protein
MPKQTMAKSLFVFQFTKVQRHYYGLKALVTLFNTYSALRYNAN